MASTVWRGRLAFGMVSIPVRLHKAARRERIRFHHVYRPADVSEAADVSEPAEEEGREEELPALPPPEPVARVHNLPVAEDAETRVAPPQILKAFEVEKDRYVTFQPKELAALRPKTSTELTIAEFVRLEEIDPIYFDTSYYAVPDRGGEKPYALLREALEETRYAAVGSLAMHGREHATVIRPGRHGLILHTLFFENEVRAAEEYRGDSVPVNPKELTLAKAFVEALAAPFDPGKLKDAFEERLRALIEERAATAVSTYSEAGPAPRAPVIDIMEALRKSLEIARKPPASEPRKAPKKRRRQA